MRTELKTIITKLWYRRTSNIFNISKELWFPEIGVDFIKYWKVYRLITEKQYHRALNCDSRSPYLSFESCGVAQIE